LEVARQLFFEKGIYLAKVEDITEAADLGKGTFYKYFDSKETIIRVLLEEGLGELLLKTEQAVKDASSSGKVLAAVIGTRVDFFLAYPDYLLLFHQVRGLMQLQVAAAKDLREVYDIHLRRLAQLVKPTVKVGGAASARDLVTAIAAYTSGLLTYHVLFDGQEAVRRRRDYFVRVLERSLQALLKTGNGSLNLA
jgi:AcrR family transcriptional regulator